MTSFDAIIIGAGHNGLVSATVLAKAGRKVLVLEASDAIGGAAKTVEFAPGYRTSGVAHIVNRLDPEVASVLKLDRSVSSGDMMPTVVLSLDKGPIVLRGAYGDKIDGITPEEQRAFNEMKKKLTFQASLLKRFLKRRPPEIGKITFKDMKDFGLAGLSLISKGKEEGRDFLRMMLMNVADVVDEYLTDERLQALVAFDATLGIHLGPRSPTSLLGFYYRLIGEANGAAGGQFLPKGGMGRVADAFASAAKHAGVTIRTSAPVRRIVSKHGVASGVILENGETINAPVIVAAVHPKTTFLKLADPVEVDTQFKTQIDNIRSKGNVAKFNLALKKVPQFTGVSAADHKGRLVIARTVRHVEEAFNPAKYGQFSPDPVMEITLPSLSDPSMAPAGGCTLSALVQFAPYELKQGWENGRAAFEEIILATLERYAPGIRDLIDVSELLTPADIEARYNMPGGHWHHGELQVDQLLINRPIDLAAGYSTPIEGLYLASAGSHPGGGVSGLPGLLSARHILSGGRS
nr:NAD(P)/FAD-dependent oxidoreductase [uncultured Gellertiella sp.]